MSGFQAHGNITNTSDWTAINSASLNNSGSALKMSPNNLPAQSALSNAPTAQQNSAFSAASSTPSGLIPPMPDEYLFANSGYLFGETLLALAARYSNAEISKYIGFRDGTDQLILGQSGVSSRVTAALKERATATNKTLDEARADLKQARESHKSAAKAAGGTKKSRDKKPKVEPAPQAGVATQGAAPTAPAASESMDVEMTDADSANEHKGYSAAEVDAANALLSFSTQPTREVLNAVDLLMALPATVAASAVPRQVPNDVLIATGILMRLNRNKPSLAVAANRSGDTTDEEVSDDDMSDAEKAAFVADFVAGWREPSGGRYKAE